MKGWGFWLDSDQTRKEDMSNLYELHITVNVADEGVAEAVAKKEHWKTSKIMGDPVLGHKPFFYLTTYVRSFTEGAAKETLASGVFALRQAGIAVIREKIEHIIHDVRH